MPRGFSLKPLLAVKILALFLTLLIVMYLMQHVNDASVQKVFHALGVDTGGGSDSPGFQASGRPRAPGEQRLSICPTRIRSMTWSDGRKIEEVDKDSRLRWMGHAPDERELTYLEMERWLSQHCQVV